MTSTFKMGHQECILRAMARFMVHEQYVELAKLHGHKPLTKRMWQNHVDGFDQKVQEHALDSITGAVPAVKKAKAPDVPAPSLSGPAPPWPFAIPVVEPGKKTPGIGSLLTNPDKWRAGDRVRSKYGIGTLVEPDGMVNVWKVDFDHYTLQRIHIDHLRPVEIKPGALVRLRAGCAVPVGVAGAIGKVERDEGGRWVVRFVIGGAVVPPEFLAVVRG